METSQYKRVASSLLRAEPRMSEGSLRRSQRSSRPFHRQELQARIFADCQRELLRDATPANRQLHSVAGSPALHSFFQTAWTCNCDAVDREQLVVEIEA